MQVKVITSESITSKAGDVSTVTAHHIESQQFERGKADAEAGYPTREPSKSYRMGYSLGMSLPQSPSCRERY